MTIVRGSQMNKKTVEEEQGFLASNNRMNMDSAAVPTPPSAKITVEGPSKASKTDARLKFLSMTDDVTKENCLRLSNEWNKGIVDWNG